MDWWTGLDSLLIFLYRLTGWPVADYFIGTFLLAVITVIIGDFTTSLVYLANRGYFKQLNTRLAELHEMSMLALRLKEKSNYKAVNREANDTFGLIFFGMFGLSASYLWPAFFALAWMQDRFGDIRFPLFVKDWTTGYFTTFLIIYILVRILFSMIKPHLPYFRHVMSSLDEQKTKVAVEEKAG
jgi:hypothetical protein